MILSDMGEGQLCTTTSKCLMVNGRITSLMENAVSVSLKCGATKAWWKKASCMDKAY